MIIQTGNRQIQYIESISDVAEFYDGFFLDIWGVLHDSANPYPGVIYCLQKLKTHGKKIILISNAARRYYVLEKELTRFGITKEMYDHVYTSGELTWELFKSGHHPLLNNLGKKCFLMGSESYGLTEGLDLHHTQNLEEAEFILNIGVIGNPNSTKDYEDVLHRALRLDLTMVCANPDRLVVRDGVMGVAAGAIGARYENLGGKVVYFGKPHKQIYQKCLDLMGSRIPIDKIVAIGDALFTDIAGANQIGVDSILVGSGIHNKDLSGLPKKSKGLEEICYLENQYPTSVVAGFFW